MGIEEFVFGFGVASCLQKNSVIDLSWFRVWIGRCQSIP